MGGPALSEQVDLLIVGGGINGAGIARDAAGRGLSVLLVEKDDLASHTSRWSSKLIHGGPALPRVLRVPAGARGADRARGAAARRAAHHLAADLRPAAQPRAAPAWLIRLGLFLYDHLGGREILPARPRSTWRAPVRSATR